MTTTPAYGLGDPAALTRGELEALRLLASMKNMKRLKGGFGTLGRVQGRFDKAWSLEKRGLVQRSPATLQITAKGLETLDIANTRKKVRP